MLWDGSTWYYNKRARYYYDRNGMLLHRAVWSRVHGPVPVGYEVHHINRERWDNRLANLELLTVSDHRRLTAVQRDDPGWTEGRSARTSNGLIEYWARREPVERICDICDQPFRSTGMRAKRCSPVCKREANRRYAANLRDQRRAGGGAD